MRKVSLKKLEVHNKGAEHRAIKRRVDLVARGIVAGNERLYRLARKLKMDDILLHTVLECVKQNTINKMVIDIINQVHFSDLGILNYQRKATSNILELIDNVYANIDDVYFIEKVVVNNVIFDYRIIDLLSVIEHLSGLRQFVGDVVEHLSMSRNKETLQWVSKMFCDSHIDADYTKFLFNEAVHGEFIHSIIEREVAKNNIDGIMRFLYDDKVPDTNKGSIVIALARMALQHSTRIPIRVLESHRRQLLSIADWLIRNNKLTSILTTLIPKQEQEKEEYIRRLLDYVQEYKDRYNDINISLGGILGVMVVVDITSDEDEGKFKHFNQALEIMNLKNYNDIVESLHWATDAAYYTIVTLNSSKKVFGNMIRFITDIIEKLVSEDQILMYGFRWFLMWATEKYNQKRK